MNDIFYFAIMLIVSQTEVKVIYNKVSVAEYQRYETGTSESKSYSNSQDGLMLYLKDKEVFSENNQLNEMFINLAGEKAGFMQALNPKYTKTDVE
ncbi:MAG: hypothetical protein JWM28_2213, partial [Chitinophagaceae bacterium]|nr:hypothetical protein [Chitinophagaceae bacterium]